VSPQQPARLTEAEIDAIAEKAAEKALEKVYTEVGKSVVKKAMWVIGVGTFFLMVWLAGKGVPVIGK
jgi:hypothetical protein